jgi:hypothetical protein
LQEIRAALDSEKGGAAAVTGGGTTPAIEAQPASPSTSAIPDDATTREQA